MSDTRVVVVDDHALFRSGVRAELEGRVDIVGDAASVAEAVEVIAATGPDVVLLDVHLPGRQRRGRDRRASRRSIRACASSRSASRTPRRTSSR